MARAMKHTTHEQHRTQLFCAVLLVMVGCAIAICGFFAPPKGEIHGSVFARNSRIREKG